MTRIFLFSTTILLACSLQAQRTIELNNPSFEGFPRHGEVPKGWSDCGFKEETPPDIHPVLGGGEFEVTQAPQHQSTYLGMVVRNNETHESVSQYLRTPLKAGQCYDFSIYIARSILYKSRSRITEEEANYATPCKLRIWAGNGYCDRSFLLGETTEIVNTRWLKKTFRFEPDADYYYILFEAYFKTPVLFPYNGNILLDNASDIVPVSCGDELPATVDVEDLEPEPPTAVNEPPKTEDRRPTTPPTQTVKTPEPPVKPPVITQSPKPKPSTTLGGVSREELTEGKTMRIDRLYFQADKAEIQRTSFDALNEVYEFLRDNQDVTIEVGGHTNGIPAHPFCDSLSTARAKAVARYLVRKGIASKRIQYKGYGKRQLIADDGKLSGRRKNQRVEIKILSIDS